MFIESPDYEMKDILDFEAAPSRVALASSLPPRLSQGPKPKGVTRFQNMGHHRWPMFLNWVLFVSARREVTMKVIL